MNELIKVEVELNIEEKSPLKTIIDAAPPPPPPLPPPTIDQIENIQEPFILEDSTATHYGKGPNDFYCTICYKIFLTEFAVRWHIQTHFADPTKPNILAYSNTSDIMKIGKMKSSSNDGEFYFESNDNDFERKGMFFTCKLCHSNFLTEIAIRMHVRVHAFESLQLNLMPTDPLKQEPIDDDDVDDDMDNDGVVNERISISEFHCTLCLRRFASDNLLQLHITHDHQTEDMKQYKCDICPEQFFKRKDLKIHIQTHNRNYGSCGMSSGNMDLKCTICAKQFQRKKSFLTHMLTHSNADNPYKCEKKWKTLQKKRVVSNKQEHSNEQFECDICEWTFPQKHLIERHMIEHANQKRYECDLCSKEFYRKNLIKSHLLAHVGSKRYECKLCNKKFSYRTAFKKHMIKDHADVDVNKMEMANV